MNTTQKQNCYDLGALRSDNLAHIMSVIGIASFLRNVAEVGWDENRYAFVESPLSKDEINEKMREGFARMRQDYQAIVSAAKPDGAMNHNVIETGTGKRQGKGRKRSTKETLDVTENKDENTKKEKIPMAVRLLSEGSFSLTESAKDAIAGHTSVANRNNGELNKTQAMIGKHNFLIAISSDTMRIEKIKMVRGFIDEFSNIQNMLETTLRMRAGKAGCGYDHQSSAFNIGINQSEMSSEKRLHPMLEWLVAEGLCALPVQTTKSEMRKPFLRGMIPDGESAYWTLPIWKPALSYLEIEDLLADSRPWKTFRDDLLDVRVFKIYKNGKSMALSSEGSLTTWKNDNKKYMFATK